MISFSCSLPSLQAHYINSQNDFSCLKKLHSLKSAKELKQIHSLIIKSAPSLQSQKLLYTNILSLCASTTAVADFSYILSLFAQLPGPSINDYNSIVRCLLDSKTRTNSMIVLLFYCVLVERGLFGDTYTYPLVFKACARLCELRVGEMVHAHVIKNGFVLDLFVGNALMRFYGVCGVIRDVKKVFDGSLQWDVASWTLLMQGYVDNGYWKQGVDVFFDMCRAGYRADEKMMVVVISACAKLGDLSLCRKLHEYICNHRVNCDVFVENALVDMYLKCGDVESAHEVFNDMSMKNVVSWNSMISGLAQKGDYKEALSMFRNMQDEGIKPDDFTLVAVLNSCANLGVLELGKWVHAYLDKNHIEADGFIGNALMDMYAKCGSIVSALGVFEGMKTRDVYTYSTVVTGLAMHGEGVMALQFFSEMVKIGIQPDEVAFVGALTACTHAGLVEEGRKYFADMSRVHKIKPQMEHYGCMVDLFGRAGLISEAVEFVENMPLEPDAFIWATLLGACRMHKKVDLAESIMKQLAQVKLAEDGTYVLMSNIYASANKRNEALRLRKEMKKQKLRKIPGCSSIELDGVVHEFRKGDKTHPSTGGIYMVLNKILCHLNDAEQLVNDNAYS